MWHQIINAEAHAGRDAINSEIWAVTNTSGNQIDASKDVQQQRERILESKDLLVFNKPNRRMQSSVYASESVSFSMCTEKQVFPLQSSCEGESCLCINKYIAVESFSGSHMTSSTWNNIYWYWIYVFPEEIARHRQQHTTATAERNFLTCEFFGPSSSSENVDDIENFSSLSENQVNLGFYDFIHRLALVSSFFCMRKTQFSVDWRLSKLVMWLGAAPKKE